MAVSFSGFASIVTGKLNNTSAEYGRYGASWSVRTDTRLGLQALAPITDSLSLTGQVVMQGYSYEANDAYEPDIDLLFMAYQMSPEIRWRVGRLRTPFFAMSEYLPVGYAYPWITPPREVYNTSFQALSQTHGLDFTYTQDFTRGEVTLGMILGAVEGAQKDFTMKGEPAFGINLSYHRFPWTMSYRLYSARGSQRYGGRVEKALIPGYQMYETLWSTADKHLFGALADAHRVDKQWLHYQALGLGYQQDSWRYDAEINAISPPQQGAGVQLYAGYFSISKFINQFEYFALVGYQKVRLNDAIDNAVTESYAVVGQGADPVLDQLREASLSFYPAINSTMKTASAGLRWDVMDSLAVKYEIRYTTDFETFSINNSEPVDVLLNRVALDYVF